MKSVIIICVCLFSYVSYADSSCLDKYKSSYEKKKARYLKAKSRFIRLKSQARNSEDLLIASVGNSLKSPQREDYNLFEEDILNSLKPDLGYDTKLIAKIKKESTTDVSSNDIRLTLKDGFRAGKFCSFWGRKRSNAIARWAIKHIRNHSDTVYAVDVEIVNDGSSKEDNFQIIKVEKNIDKSKVQKD